jgi:hypothetical protein
VAGNEHGRLALLRFNASLGNLDELLKLGFETERVETGVAALDVRKQQLIVPGALRAVEAGQPIFPQPPIIELERRLLQVEMDVLQ